MRLINIIPVLALLNACPLVLAEPNHKSVPASDKASVSSPVHIIQPPDIVQIELSKVVPVGPYRIEVFDVLQIHATTPDEPIDRFCLVEAEGSINLGPEYGSFRVAGMTIQQITKTLNEELKNKIARPGVSVTLARVSGAQPVTGHYLVGHDGTINMRQYGVVKIGGKTIADAKTAIEKRLAKSLDSPMISLEVVDCDSNVYYVITQCGCLGGNIRSVPLSGNETVLDAVAEAGGLTTLSDKKVWIARADANDFGKQKIVPIDLDGITQRASTATCYRLLPGDRFYIADDELASFAKVVSKITTGNEGEATTPIQPASEIPGSGSTVPARSTDHGYNRIRNGI
jgi:protein involved in polysaccharide export with SLBB domain